jgi:hypothetical protein
MRGYFARFFVNHERTHRQLHLMEGTWVNAIRLVGDTKFVATNESAVAVGALGLDKLLAQSEANDFFEKRFKMAADAVTAYEALAADARQAGGFLSDHQVYSSREVPETAKPKLAWQEALDRCLLTFTLGRFDWSLPIDPAAVREPIYLWLKAAQAYGDDPKKAASAKPLVVEAQTEVEHRSKAKTLCYSWSFPALEVEAEIYDLLYSVHIKRARTLQHSLPFKARLRRRSVLGACGFSPGCSATNSRNSGTTHSKPHSAHLQNIRTPMTSS